MAKRNLHHAKDDRTLAEFYEYMPKADEKEGIWSDILRNEISFRSRKNIKVENYGCGHDGKIILNAEDVNSKPDKKFIIDDKEVLIEIKAYDRSTGDPREMITIKLHSLKECVKHNAFIIIPSPDVWALIPSACIEYILEKGDPQIYEGFSPNDLAIRCSSMEISLMLDAKAMKIYSWEDIESGKKIEKNWKKLFIKEKKK